MVHYSTSPLGKKTDYKCEYDSSLLYAIPRNVKRFELGLSGELPFRGYDIWTAYELSWLNPKGKPMVGMAEIIVPFDSPNMIESKSFKLYLNSFNQTHFKSFEDVIATIEKDVSEKIKASVDAYLFEPEIWCDKFNLQEPQVTCLDDLDIEVTEYMPNAKLLKAGKSHKREFLGTNLLKSNCLVTNQPDWATVFVSYEGPEIDHSSLLKYICSFRNHNEFHEQCVERIYTDILRECAPEKLSVYARYTRRGGLDINPFRSNFEDLPPIGRLPRQ